MSQTIDIPLHDIMPLLDVSEPSIYWFSVLVSLGLIFFASSVILFLKWNRDQKINERQKHYEALKKIDFKNPKQSAYTITKEGYFFSHDTEQTFNAYQNLFARLEPYKYAPTVQKIDEETVTYYYGYLEMVKV
ncbi:MAG TPA: hypothetical protein VFX68_03405 [Sulfuricurvum sp.]|nr:hypothetical protein [Sulfuricurvum sp.]